MAKPPPLLNDTNLSIIDPTPEIYRRLPEEYANSAKLRMECYLPHASKKRTERPNYTKSWNRVILNMGVANEADPSFIGKVCNQGMEFLASYMARSHGLMILRCRKQDGKTRIRVIEGSTVLWRPPTRFWNKSCHISPAAMLAECGVLVRDVHVR